jgi:hypothetical protein
MFCIKFQVLLKVFSFFLVEIQLLSAQKQMSFRRRIFDALRTWRHPEATILSGFKDGGQVIVPVYGSSSLRVHCPTLSPH